MLRARTSKDSKLGMSCSKQESMRDFMSEHYSYSVCVYNTMGTQSKTASNITDTQLVYNTMGTQPQTASDSNKDDMVYHARSLKYRTQRGQKKREQEEENAVEYHGIP